MSDLKEFPDWIKKHLPPQIERKLIQVEDQNFHVMEVGKGQPILLLHGNPTWGFLYRKIMSELKDEPYRFIIPDLIGLGFSSKPSFKRHTLEQHAEWLSQLIQKLKLKKIIVGIQDWGGPIGTLALSKSKIDVSGMVIMNTVLTPPKPNFKPTWFHRFSQKPIISDVVFRGLSYPQSCLHKVQGDPGSIQGEIKKAYCYPLKGLSHNAAPLALARMVPDSLEHPSIDGFKKCEEYIKGYNGKASIIWGMKDPILGRLYKRTCGLLPQAKTYETNAGHFIQEEEAPLIASVIKNMAEEIKST